MVLLLPAQVLLLIRKVYASLETGDVVNVSRKRVRPAGLKWMPLSVLSVIRIVKGIAALQFYP